MAEERREGFSDFKHSIEMLLASEHRTHETLETMKIDHMNLAKIAVATDTRLESVTNSMNRVSDNIEKVAAQAVNAHTLSQENKERNVKTEKIQRTLAEIVAKHDNRIEHLETASRTGLIKWGIAAGFLILIFVMFSVDPDAAGQAVEAVKGHAELDP